MKQKTNKSNFNDYRFKGLDYKKVNDKQLTMNRVSDDETKVVVRLSEEHLFETKYGYGVYLDTCHGAWANEWQVSLNGPKTEIVFDKQYFKIVDFDFDEELIENGVVESWDDLVSLAQSQQEDDIKVVWKVTKAKAKTKKDDED